MQYSSLASGALRLVASPPLTLHSTPLCRVATRDRMGVCQSDMQNDAEIAASREIDRQGLVDERKKQACQKLLLLGAGESGKSTLFKQLNHIWGEGYSEPERMKYVPMLHSNAMQAIQTLVLQAELHPEVDYLDTVLDCRLSPAIASSVELIKNLDPDEADFTDVIAHAITQVWADPGIKNMYLVRSRYQLLDSAEYFFNHVMNFAQPDFCPSYEDILRCRTKTTGIVETKFSIKGNQFHVFDVGGQRNERRKWIHCFEGVTAVVFVAAISAYNQTLYEDNTINRLAEALALFEEIANSRWFRDTAIILFLNKSDLFREKIKKTPITITFPEYENDPHDFDQSAQYIQSCFEDRNVSGYGDVYSHITCATDTNNVNRVFLSAKDIVIRASLKKGGLLM